MHTYKIFRYRWRDERAAALSSTDSLIDDAHSRTYLSVVYLGCSTCQATRGRVF